MATYSRRRRRSRSPSRSGSRSDDSRRISNRLVRTVTTLTSMSTIEIPAAQPPTGPAPAVQPPAGPTPRAVTVGPRGGRAGRRTSPHIITVYGFQLEIERHAMDAKSRERGTLLGGRSEVLHDLLCASFGTRAITSIFTHSSDEEFSQDN